MTYESDFVQWSEQQAALLRRRATSELDWENIAEEIESLGRSDRREIRSRLAIICAHLLQWSYQSEQRSASWRGSIVEARQPVGYLLEDSPSLRSFAAAALAPAYALGRQKAFAETGLLSLPSDCPWSADEVLDANFRPQA